ncbi:hypothetical protein ACFY7Y_38185 [Streptomyces virginiae]|uniref:hypothetical protein n=1 Tax=Streptomyces virginiae TaxID=1961 RepID=UPI00368F296F
MSEREKENETGAVAGAAPDVVGDAAPGVVGDAAEAAHDATGPTRRVKTGVVRLVAAAVGVVVLVGGGLWCSAALDDAERTAPTRYWMPEGAPTGSPAPVPSVPVAELKAKLLPLTTGYWPGPDIDAEGNDYFVSGERAVQAFKDDHSGLSTGDREARDKALADLKLKGLAGRSYARGNGGGAMVSEIQLMQADPKELGKFAEFAKMLLELTGADGQAPKVDGFPDAKCARGSVVDGKKQEIATLECVALEGDVLVTYRAYGWSPGFSASDVTALFKEQLNHLKSPGESV